MVLLLQVNSASFEVDIAKFSEDGRLEVFLYGPCLTKYENRVFFDSALRDPQHNEAEVLLSCGVSLYWEDGKIIFATFHCSFLSNLTMHMTTMGTKGSLHVHDLIIPYQEKEASFFAGSKSKFKDLVTGWCEEPSKHVVTIELPQEAEMVREFARLVCDIKFKSLKPEKKWPTISRKTQLIVDVVKTSIEKGFESVHISE